MIEGTNRSSYLQNEMNGNGRIWFVSAANINEIAERLDAEGVIQLALDKNSEEAAPLLMEICRRTDFHYATRQVTGAYLIS